MNDWAVYINDARSLVDICRADEAGSVESGWKVGYTIRQANEIFYGLTTKGYHRGHVWQWP